VRRLLLVLVALVLLTAACGGDDTIDLGTASSTTSVLPPIPEGGDEQVRLDAARTRWDAAGIEDYDWTYARRCFCPPLEVEVHVEGGAAVARELRPGDGSVPADGTAVEILTMVDLFDVVQEAIEEADGFSVAYDPDTGRVVALDVDPIENAVDDEFGYEVRSFVVAGEVSGLTAQALDEAALSESWGCGRGFHLSNPDQTVALMLDLIDPTWTEGPAQVTTLPDGGWEARVLLGADLFSNWCDDVVDASDPEPRVDQTWRIVAGTITFEDDVATLPISCGPVRARIEGLQVEGPDGAQVTIADRDIENDCWAGAAG
jgi:hypothetical protein